MPRLASSASVKDACACGCEVEETELLLSVLANGR